MPTLRDRLLHSWSMLRSGKSAQALDYVESLRGEALASTDALDHAAFFQTLAAALDVEGRSDRALEASRAAVAIDLEHRAESRAALASLRSLVLILKRLGRKEEAEPRARELLAMGETLGGVSFASAAVEAVDYVPRGERVALLERAKFHCKTVLAEAPPTGADREVLAETLAAVVFKLAHEYALAERIGEAEELLLVVTRLVAPLVATPALRRALANAWSRLALLSGYRRARVTQRLFLRYAAAVLNDPSSKATDQRSIEAALARVGGPHAPDDPQPLDVFRLVRAGSPMWVAHPLRGCHPLTESAAGGSWRPGDAIDVAVDASGRAHARQ